MKNVRAVDVVGGPERVQQDRGPADATDDTTVRAYRPKYRLPHIGRYVVVALAGAVVGGVVVGVATRALPKVMAGAMRHMMAGMAAGSAIACGDR